MGHRQTIDCSSSPGFLKSCHPTETVAHSTHPAPPSPTPLPSATDNHWPPNSHIPSPPHSYKPSSIPHPCNTPESNPPAPTAHCSTSPRHTNPPSAPDDSPPCLFPHSQSCSRGSSRSCIPPAIDSNSPSSCPCK